MHRLAKLGFTQSYTYFTWRTTRDELTEYFTELAQGPGREYFRPNCWPNTPDILPYHLQNAGLPMFRLRYTLAATLAANIGIYGPAFELAENRPRDPGTSEEYLESEKYEIKRWDTGASHSLAPFVTRPERDPPRARGAAVGLEPRLPRIGQPAGDLLFEARRQGPILTAVNLDPHHVQSTWVHLDMKSLGLEENAPFTVVDELTGERYPWRGPHNFVMLDPASNPPTCFR
jgi:starch synthase (maltosyl-transferring)